MSFEAVLGRIQEIAAAQQQLSVGPLHPGSTSANGALQGTSGTTASAVSSFADALTQAQSTPAQIPGVGYPAPATSGVQGAVIPQTAWNPERKPIAAWIAPILQWASEHGWSGTVTSGYRTYQQQAAINASGAYSAPAGTSNHETTQYPGGAVDVTDPSQLISVLKNYTGPYKLVGGVLGSVDPEHFSASGH
jgi:hypothetical protein